jgi:hypothetical protein
VEKERTCHKRHRVVSGHVELAGIDESVHEVLSEGDNVGTQVSDGRRVQIRIDDAPVLSVDRRVDLRWDQQRLRRRQGDPVLRTRKPLVVADDRLRLVVRGRHPEAAVLVGVPGRAPGQSLQHLVITLGVERRAVVEASEEVVDLVVHAVPS